MTSFQIKDMHNHRLYALKLCQYYFKFKKPKVNEITSNEKEKKIYIYIYYKTSELLNIHFTTLQNFLLLLTNIFFFNHQASSNIELATQNIDCIINAPK